MANLNVMTYYAKHLRSRLAVAGIKSRVACGNGTIKMSVHVFPVACDITFTESEQRTIRQIAVDNGMERVRGMPIVVEQMTDPWGMSLFVTDKMVADWRANLDRYGLDGRKHLTA